MMKYTVAVLNVIGWESRDDGTAVVSPFESSLAQAQWPVVGLIGLNSENEFLVFLNSSKLNLDKTFKFSL